MKRKNELGLVDNLIFRGLPPDSAALALLEERATALDQKAKTPDPKTG